MRLRARGPAIAGVVVVLILGAVAWFVLGDSGESPGSGSSNEPVIVNTLTPPATLDAQQGTSFADNDVAGQLYVRLTQYPTEPGPEGTRQVDPTRVEGYLAESWDVSADGRTYTLQLRDGLTFPSGRPVDSEAVKYSFERALGLSGAYFVTNGLPENIKSVAAPSPDTVVIELRQPDPEAPKGWASAAAAIVDPGVVQKHGENYLASHDAGSGPYTITEYQPNSRVVLEARPEYWKWAGEEPGAEEIIVNFVNSDSTALLQAKSGEADVTMGLSAQSAASLDDDDSLRVIENPTANTEQVILAWDRPPFDDPLVREAVASAVPYEQILTDVAEEAGELFYGPLSPNIPFFNEELSPSVSFDLDRARELIQESGVKTPIPVTLTIDQGNRLHEQIAAILQDTWDDIDIRVRVQQLAAAQYSEALFGNKVQAALRNDGPAAVDAGFFLGYDMRCEVVGIGPNLGNICIPKADRLLDRARRTASEEERQTLYDEIAELWRDEYPKIFLYGADAVTVLGPEVSTWTYATAADMRTWGK